MPVCSVDRPRWVHSLAGGHCQLLLGLLEVWISSDFSNIAGAVSSCLCLSASPQTSPFLTCTSDRFQVLKRCNKNGHPGHSGTVSNSCVVFCYISQGSIYLLSMLNNMSNFPLGEENGSLLSFHLYVAQEATTPSAASILSQRNSG